MLALALLIIIIVFSIVFYRYTHHNLKPPGVSPVVVEFAKVIPANWHTEVVTTGTVRAFNGVTINAELDGRVTQIFVKPAQMVKKDQPLYQINPETLLAELKGQQATLELNKIRYKQQQKLYASKDGAMLDFDIAKEALQNTEADIARVNAQLNLALVRASFDGQVGVEIALVGDYVKAGQPLISLQNLDSLRIDFEVPQVYLKDLAVGQTVKARFDAFPGLVVMAKTYAINTDLTTSSRTVQVRARLLDPPKALLPGTFAHVTLELPREKPVLIVPGTSIIYSLAGNSVYRVAAGKAIKTPITLGEQQGDNVAILTGLSAGDTVVSIGQIKLRNGMSVTDAPTAIRGDK